MNNIYAPPKVPTTNRDEISKAHWETQEFLRLSYRTMGAGLWAQVTLKRQPDQKVASPWPCR